MRSARQKALATARCLAASSCSCVVRREDLKRAGGRLKANTLSGFDGVPNEILKEVIEVYPQILLEAFNSCLREGRFFVD